MDKYPGQNKDFTHLVRRSGRQIGSRDMDDFYVMDGKVYRITNEEATYIHDYLVFCRLLRIGGVDGFVPRNNFHLNNGGE